MPDARRFLPLTPAVFHVLLALAEGDRHGYGIIQDVAEATGGEVTLRTGTLYTILKRLLEERLIEESGRRPRANQDDERRRYYGLTPPRARRRPGRGAAARADGHAGALAPDAAAPGARRRPMTRLFALLLRLVRRDLDVETRHEMTLTFDRVLAAARRRGRLAALAAFLAETADLAVASFRRDPLSPPRCRRESNPPSEVSACCLLFRTGGPPCGAPPRNPATRSWSSSSSRWGLQINTVIFSVADAAMFRGLPYPSGSRLVEIFNDDPVGRFSSPGLLPETVSEWRGHAELFDAVEGMNFASFIVVGGAEPEEMSGAFITPGLFAALGLRPALGRLFQPEDAEPGRDRVVIISDTVWRKRFGADPDATGRTLTLNDQTFTVVGVMPPHFRYPAGPQQIWLPTPLRQPQGARLDVVAILKAGLTREAAQSRAKTLAVALTEQRPRPGGWGIRFMDPRGVVLNKSTRQALQILTAAVFLVLLIACANVANLFFAQALARTRELSIRAALGASRGRLIRELLAESLVLGAAGGAIGLGLAYWGVGLAIALAPIELTRFAANEIRIDQRMLAFTALVTVGTGLLFGILPAWRASRINAGDALKSRTGTSAVAHARLRGMLVVGEVALSCILLDGRRAPDSQLRARAGGRARLRSVEPAERHAQPADRSVSAAGPTNLSRADREIAWRHCRVVEGVTIANGVPTSGGNIRFGELEAENGLAETGESVVPETIITPNYFATLGIPIRDGRSFLADEPVDSTIISEGFARRLWPGGSAVGKRVRLGADGKWLTVVGVAGEVRGNRMVERQSTIEMYSPMWRPAPKTPAAPVPGPRSFDYINLVVRAPRPLTLVPAIKQVLWAIDPAQPVGDTVLVEDLLAKSLAQERFATVLMGTFAALALLLAAAGLYAVLAQLVAQRRQEIGIRMALGAATADVAGMILGRGFVLTCLGVAIGLAGAWAMARALSSQLFEVTPHDPWSFASVPIALLAVALLASWLPARRALAVNPATALRAE